MDVARPARSPLSYEDQESAVHDQPFVQGQPPNTAGVAAPGPHLTQPSYDDQNGSMDPTTS